MRDDGVQGTVVGMGGTTVLDPGILLARELLCEHLYEARFPNAGFIVEQHHLPQPVLDLGPAFPEEGHFGVAPDQRRQASDGSHVEPGLGALACSTRYTRSRWASPLSSCMPKACKIK